MFCLFGLVNIEQDVSSLKFGNTFIVFKEMNEFIRRMQEELTKKGYENHVRAVQYEDKESYDGKMGFFTKFTTHIRQSEVRFVARTYLKERLIIELGSLTDIAEIGSLSNIRDYISKHKDIIDVDPTNSVNK